VDGYTSKIDRENTLLFIIYNDEGAISSLSLKVHINDDDEGHTPLATSKSE